MRCTRPAVSSITLAAPSRPVALPGSSTSAILPDRNRCPSIASDVTNRASRPPEAPAILDVPQGAIEPRRRHLQRVRLVERELGVEQRADVPADALAVFHGNAVAGAASLSAAGVPVRRPIDDHPQHPSDRLATELHVEDVEPGIARHPRRQGPHPRHPVLSGHHAVQRPETRRSGRNAHFFQDLVLRTIGNYTMT